LPHLTLTIISLHTNAQISAAEVACQFKHVEIQTISTRTFFGRILQFSPVEPHALTALSVSRVGAGNVDGATNGITCLGPSSLPVADAALEANLELVASAIGARLEALDVELVLVEELDAPVDDDDDVDDEDTSSVSTVVFT